MSSTREQVYVWVGMVHKKSKLVDYVVSGDRQNAQQLTEQLFEEYTPPAHAEWNTANGIQYELETESWAEESAKVIKTPLNEPASIFNWQKNQLGEADTDD